MKDYNIKSNLDEINLPVKKGDKVGTLDVYSGSEKEKSIDLIAQNNLNSIFAFITENALYFNIFKGVLGLAVILTVVKIGFKIKKKRNK